MVDFICDLDGTVADCSHRMHWITTKPRNFKAFYSGIPYDRPIPHVINVVRNLIEWDNRVVFCTGRSIEYVDATTKWINDHILYGISMEYDIFMREKQDFRPDNIVKEELLSEIKEAGYNPVFAFEDRSRVRDMWIRNGIFVFDVSQGKGDF